MTCFPLSLFFFSHDLFKCPFADLAGNKFAAKLAAPRRLTLLKHKPATIHSSPHNTTLPLPTQPHPTYSSPHPPLAPSTPHMHLQWNFVHFCSPNIPLSCLHNNLTVEWERRSVNPQPWHFTNNILGLSHAQSFSVCLCSWVYVVCVCFLLYLSVYLCLVRCVLSVLWRGACLVFCFIFISPFFNFKTHNYMNVVVLITLCIWLYLFHHHL